MLQVTKVFSNFPQLLKQLSKIKNAYEYCDLHKM